MSSWKRAVREPLLLYCLALEDELVHFLQHKLIYVLAWQWKMSTLCRTRMLSLGWRRKILASPSLLVRMTVAVMLTGGIRLRSCDQTLSRIVR